MSPSTPTTPPPGHTPPRSSSHSVHAGEPAPAAEFALPARQAGRPRRHRKKSVDKNTSRLYNLQLDINALQAEIQRLESLREILRSRHLTQPHDLHGSLVHRVALHHKLFRHGLHDVSYDLESRPVDPRNVFESLFAEDVRFGGFHGRELLLQQFRQHTHVFPSITVDLVGLHVLPSPLDEDQRDTSTRLTVRAHVSYMGSIAQTTVDVLFPRLVRHVSYRALVDRLLGQRFKGQGMFDFVFDTSSSQVVAYDWSNEISMAIARVLGNPHDMALLTQEAVIQDDFFVGDLGPYMTNQHQVAASLTNADPHAPFHPHSEDNQDQEPAMSSG